MGFPIAVDKGLANTCGEVDREAFDSTEVCRRESNADDPFQARWGRRTQMVVAAGSSCLGAEVGVEQQEKVPGRVEASADFAHFCFCEPVWESRYHTGHSACLACLGRRRH
jgi:hypothetical protein